MKQYKLKTSVLFTLIFLVFLLSSCDKKVDESDKFCRVEYHTLQGKEYNPSMKWIHILDLQDIPGYDLEGIYFDEAYTKVAHLDDCTYGITLYAKQELHEYRLDVVLPTTDDTLVDTTFTNRYFNAYTTVDGGVYVDYLLPYNEPLFINVGPVLNLHQNETVIDILRTLGCIFFLTSEHRVLTQHYLTPEIDESNFNNMTEIDETFFADFDIVKMIEYDNYLFLLTTTSEVLLFTSDGYNLYRIVDFTTELESSLEPNQLVNIHYYPESNDHLLVEDNGGHISLIHFTEEDEEDFTLRPFVLSGGITSQEIINALQHADDFTIVSNNNLYNVAIGLTTEIITKPDNLLNGTETPMEFEQIFSGTYYLTDEHLYYYETEYNLSTGVTSYIPYLDKEYLDMTDLIPLEENEKINNIFVEHDVVSSSQLYILTNKGRIFVSERLYDKGEHPRPYNEMSFEDLNDTYNLTNDELFIQLYGRYNSTKLLTNKGTIITRSSTHDLVTATYYEDIIQPQSISVFTDLVTYLTDLEQLISVHFSDYIIEGYYNDPYFKDPLTLSLEDYEEKVLLFIKTQIK